VERGVLLVAGGAVRDDDVQSPRERGGPPEELLVEPVAPPPDRLRQWERRGDDVEQRRDRQPAAAANGDDPGEDAAGDAAGDAQAALSDGEHVQPAALEHLRVRDDVVHQCAAPWKLLLLCGPTAGDEAAVPADHCRGLDDQHHLVRLRARTPRCWYRLWPHLDGTCDVRHCTRGFLIYVAAEAMETQTTL